MKLNNKGMSLMELLVSIVLIGIVLTFLFQLLVDVKNETGNNDYAYNNQVNRTEAIYTIEKDLQEYLLLGIEDKSSSSNFEIDFHYMKGKDEATAVLTIDTYEGLNDLGDTVTKYYLRYTDVLGEKYSWEMKNAQLDTCGDFTYYIDSLSDNYYFKLNLYVYNSILNEKNYKDRNNAVDDIEITYAASKSGLVTTNGSYLTNSTSGEKQIGTCAN